jgi:hypothetical protein
VERFLPFHADFPDKKEPPFRYPDETVVWNFDSTHVTIERETIYGLMNKAIAYFSKETLG